MNMYACIIDISVPHEIKNQRAWRTSKIMKNGQDVITQKGKWF